MNAYLFGAWAIVTAQALRFGWLTFLDARAAGPGEWVTTEHMFPMLALSCASFLIVYGRHLSVIG